MSTVFLAGDVMTGRGVDQILPHPSEPRLIESYVRDARDYVRLAEQKNGPVPRNVEPAYIWGDALAELERAQPDARIINLETSVTTSEQRWPHKEVHYRIHPQNVACLTAANIDVCVLANNHVLDYERRGLLETLETLHRVGLTTVGAGRDRREAEAPARMQLAGGQLLVFAVGSPTSGVPETWAATDTSPGVDFVSDLSAKATARLVERVNTVRAAGDLVLVSIHWGSNWGYEVPAEQQRFAHRLIEGGVDLVYGHSSHHPRPVEVYRDKLILYGCGDFIDDYEGITGYEMYRGDLTLMYFATLDPATGKLVALRMVPMQQHRMRLRRAGPADVEWLCGSFNENCRDFGTKVVRHDDALYLRW